MKVKETKVCAGEDCNEEFRPFKSTDKFCSAGCAYKSQKPKTAKKQTPIKRTPIKQASDKRRKESYIYAKERKLFLALPENKVCTVAKAVFNETLPACEIHHKAGRRGKFLVYVPFWLAVSRKGHNWIHANPEEAYSRGFLIHSSTVKI